MTRDGTHVSDNTFKLLVEGCHKLRGLSLQQNSVISNKTLEYIVANCKDIEELNFQHARRFTPEGIVMLASLNKLRKINIDNTFRLRDDELAIVTKG